MKEVTIESQGGLNRYRVDDEGRVCGVMHPRDDEWKHPVVATSVMGCIRSSSEAHGGIYEIGSFSEELKHGYHMVTFDNAGFKILKKIISVKYF